MRIRFDETDIAVLGFRVLGIGSMPEVMPLGGALDCPKRKGKTHHLWGEGIEPYVWESDMRFERRTFSLKLTSMDREMSFKQRLNVLYGLMLKPFTIECGAVERKVIAQSVNVERKGLGWHQVTIALSETEVLPYGYFPYTGSEVVAKNGIDGVEFSDMGLIVSTLSGEDNLPVFTPFEVTNSNETDGLRAPQSVEIRGPLRTNSLTEWIEKSQRINGILAYEGCRELSMGEMLYRCFCTDGASYANIRTFNGRVYGDFSTKLFIVDGGMR